MRSDFPLGATAMVYICATLCQPCKLGASLEPGGVSGRRRFTGRILSTKPWPAKAKRVFQAL